MCCGLQLKNNAKRSNGEIMYMFFSNDWYLKQYVRVKLIVYFKNKLVLRCKYAREVTTINKSPNKVHQLCTYSNIIIIISRVFLRLKIHRCVQKANVGNNRKATRCNLTLYRIVWLRVISVINIFSTFYSSLEWSRPHSSKSVRMHHLASLRSKFSKQFQLPK